MRAMMLVEPRPIEEKPLALVDIPLPEPGPGQVRLRVVACGICHTDLHIVEGELPPHKLPLVPGHQIVGYVDALSEGVEKLRLGDHVGVPWLNATCGECAFCGTERENLCERARFTGYDVDGGFAEYGLAPADFVYPIPPGFPSLQAAPLLCAGIIGYRALRLSEIRPGGRLALFGFGASAHIAIQIARHWGCRVYVFTRGAHHRALAEQLGAEWTGSAGDEPPSRADAAIVFAPAGSLVLDALRVVDKGGTVALAGIYMTPIPEMDYARYLYHEKTLRSVANSTRQDAVELLRLAVEIPIRTEVQVFPLEQANEALLLLNQGRIEGAGVLQVSDERR
ncbi:MAG: zinc-dependent alcohol dehydrogenase family protein [Chloroflexi bacterium]|nr:zinc-dependent alcohol dehydrogenase family protein [Chloroflexota bacterium]MCL5026149.1 zinc-dependent alcohol dehydrogenase family protein [Chloroflexota bacterium]